MKCTKALVGLTLLAGLAVPKAAHAQIFTAYNPFTAEEQPEKNMTPKQRQEHHRFKRWELGLQAALWDVPAVGVSGTGGAAIKIEAQGSPLITADFFVLQNLSVGGWYNPIYGKVVGIVGGGGGAAAGPRASTIELAK